MKQTIFKLLAVFGFVLLGSSMLYAQKQPQRMSEAKIQQLDRQLTLHKAKHRKFNSKSEFERYRIRHHWKHARKQVHYNTYQYEARYYYGLPPRYNRIFAQGHRHTKRGWVLAYRYDRAAFYDRDGFYYGYFNRYGYFFEGVFYRYDRFYTYRDRVRGKGLFDRRYYPPADYRYYGFCR